MNRANRAISSLGVVLRIVSHLALLPFRASSSLSQVFFWKRSAAPKRVAAIILVEHMGDIAACEPLPRHLKRNHPDLLVSWFARKPYLDLVKSNPFIDRVFAVGCLTEWLWIRKWIIFNETYELHLEGRVCPYCNISLHRLKGDCEILEENYYEHGGLLQVYTKGYNLPEITLDPIIYIDDAIRDRVDALELPEKYIVFHALSNEETRNWNQEKWHGLLKGLEEAWDGYFVEVGLRSIFSEKPHSRLIDLCGKVSILETAEVIRRSSLFVGIDSGPAHLANAVGARGVILIGKYRSFDSYNPYSGRYGRGEDVLIISTDREVRLLPLEDVITATLSMLPARRS